MQLSASYGAGSLFMAATGSLPPVGESNACDPGLSNTCGENAGTGFLLSFVLYFLLATFPTTSKEHPLFEKVPIPYIALTLTGRVSIHEVREEVFALVAADPRGYPTDVSLLPYSNPLLPKGETVALLRLGWGSKWKKWKREARQERHVLFVISTEPKERISAVEPRAGEAAEDRVPVRFVRHFSRLVPAPEQLAQLLEEE